MEKLADIDWNSLESIATPNLSNPTIGDIIGTIIPYIYTFAGILLLLYLIYGGFSYITSLGDPKGVEAAKGKITNALIGFFIVFFSYFIIQLIASVFNIKPILDIFPTTTVHTPPGVR